MTIHVEALSPPLERQPEQIQAATPLTSAALDAHRAAVFAVCLAHCHDRHEAEDRVQDVFVKALAQLTTLRDSARLRQWLCQIARHTCRDAARRRRPTMPLPPNLAAPQSHADARLDGLLAAVQRLPEKWREILLLFYLGGRSTAAVAAALRLRPATVRQRLVRARLRLHTLLTEEQT